MAAERPRGQVITRGGPQQPVVDGNASFPADHQIVAMDHLRAAAEAENRCDIPRWPAFGFLRAVGGLPMALNQVQRAPSSMARSGCSTRPEAITMWAPPPVTILAASSFVCMPPRDNSDPAAPALASISGVMRSTSGICRADAAVPGGAS